MKKNYKIKIRDEKKYSDLLFKIVEHENEVFGEATVGNWNIKPFTKYGKVFAMLSDDENTKDELMSVIEVLSSFDREVAYVYGVSTVPKFQKHGYARILLQFVMETLKEMKIKKIELTVDMDNFIAKRIYEKLGFEIVGNLDNEYGDNIERYLMRYFVK